MQHRLLPETGFLRLPQVLSLYPVSKSTWWAGVKAGRYPAPVKLGERCTAWRAEDVRALIDGASA
ncbi:helix-turn-helix transcriptional regulator [Cognatiluteimonas weifangensis]|uniref:AlpA family phage regulatory protein n=1 Tax=Cognatiluteimonas weifangensis TaxID=2303539 RepID=A0A372DPS4_9GAMM|nr:AlpA family phage regulatory protein [Luteimonas weifangensis]RFP61563.1 AlpA family phage regulatory protein [Luteimonas weifangensis]